MFLLASVLPTFTYTLQILMPTDIERRVSSLLGSSKGESSTEKSTGASQSSKNSSSASSLVKPILPDNNVSKDKISADLKQQEEKLKVCMQMISMI